MFNGVKDILLPQLILLADARSPARYAVIRLETRDKFRVVGPAIICVGLESIQLCARITHDHARYEILDIYAHLPALGSVLSLFLLSADDSEGWTSKRRLKG